MDIDYIDWADEILKDSGEPAALDRVERLANRLFMAGLMPGGPHYSVEMIAADFGRTDRDRVYMLDPVRAVHALLNRIEDLEHELKKAKRQP